MCRVMNQISNIKRKNNALYSGSKKRPVLARQHKFAIPLAILSGLLFLLFILINTGGLYSFLNIFAATRTINFSGKIVNKDDGTNVVLGDPACVLAGADTCDFRVRIFDAISGGNQLFQEDHNDIEIGDFTGIFTLDINSICNSQVVGTVDWATTACVSNGGVDFSSSSIYIEISFSPAGDGTYTEVFGRRAFSNTASAFFAERAGSLNGLTSDDFVQLAQGTTQVNSDDFSLIDIETTGNLTDPLIVVNENGAGTPDLFDFQVGGDSIFTLDNDGLLSLSNDQGVTNLSIEESNATNDNRTLLSLINNGGAIISLEDTDSSTQAWNIIGSDEFTIKNDATPANDLLKIDDLGNAYMFNGLTINDGFDSSTISAILNFGGANTETIEWSAPNSRFEISDDLDVFNSLTVGDSVGIGTQSPSEALDVVGSVQLSGDIKTTNPSQLLPANSLDYVKNIPNSRGGVSGDPISQFDFELTDNEYFLVGAFSGSVDFDTDNSIPGDTLTSQGTDGFIAKYNLNGTLQWIKQIEGSSIESVTEVETDSAGNIYVLGNFSSSNVDIDPDNSVSGDTLSESGGRTFLAKYNSSGVLQWVKQMGQSGFLYIVGNDMYVNDSGDIHFTGYFYGGISIDFDPDNVVVNDTHSTTSFTEGDAFLAKYNTNGLIQWVHAIGTTNDTLRDSGKKVFADSGGDVILVGDASQGLFDFDEYNVGSDDTFDFSTGEGIFIVKYNSSGVAQWSKGLIDNGGQLNSGVVIADSSNNIYYTGGLQGTSNDFDDDNVVAGDTLNQINGVDSFLVKYDSSGLLQWAKALDISRTNALDITPSGEVLVGGTFNTTPDFDPDNVVSGDTVAAVGVKDIFFAKYDSTGLLTELKTIGTSGQNANLSHIAIDSSSNIYTQASYLGTIDMDSDIVISGDTISSSTTNGYYIARYSSSTQSIAGSNIGSSSSPFGNTYTNALNISAITGSTQCLEIDTNGNVSGSGITCGGLWTANGSDIYYDSGYVGIGITAPTSPLTIVESTNVSALDIQSTGITDKPSVSINELPLSVDVNTGKALEFKVTGESFGRGMFYSDGSIGFGGGTATTDVFLNRDSAGILRIDSDKAGGAADLLIEGSLGIGDNVTPTNMIDINTTGATRGISFDGRVAISGYSASSYLYLNNGNNFSGGVYAPSDFIATEIRTSTTDYGAYDIQTHDDLYVNDLGIFMGGVHVGGTSDPGTDNLIVDGNASIGNTSILTSATLRLGDDGSTYGLFMDSPNVATASTYYGLYVDEIDGGITNNYGMYIRPMTVSGSTAFGARIGEVSGATNTYGLFVDATSSQDYGVYIEGSTMSAGQYSLYAEFDIRTEGRFELGNPGSGGDDVCRVASNQRLSLCSSSIRYKDNVLDYSGGLDLLKQFRSVSFDWKETGISDMGFIAEEVEAIEPLLVFYRDGKVEGVRYKQMTALMKNAVIEIDDRLLDVESRLDLLAGGSGTSAVTSLTEAIITGKLTVDGLVDFNEDTVATATIGSGDTEVEIIFSESYSTPPVITVTPEGEDFINSGVTYTIIDKDEDGFKIKISDPYTEDLLFNWHAFE